MYMYIHICKCIYTYTYVYITTHTVGFTESISLGRNGLVINYQLLSFIAFSKTGASSELLL